MGRPLFAIAFVQYILAKKKNPIDVLFSRSSRRNQMFPQRKNSPIKRSKEKVIKLAIFVYGDIFEKSRIMVYSKSKFSFLLKTEDYG